MTQKHGHTNLARRSNCGEWIKEKDQGASNYCRVWDVSIMYMVSFSGLKSVLPVKKTELFKELFISKNYSLNFTSIGEVRSYSL